MALCLTRAIKRDRDELRNLLVLTLPDGLEILIHTRDGARPDSVLVVIEAPPGVRIERGEVYARRKRERRAGVIPIRPTAAPSRA